MTLTDRTGLVFALIKEIQPSEGQGEEITEKYIILYTCLRADQITPRNSPVTRLRSKYIIQHNRTLLYSILVTSSCLSKLMGQ